MFHKCYFEISEVYASTHFHVHRSGQYEELEKVLENNDFTDKNSWEFSRTAP